MIEECLVVEFAVTGDDCPLATATRETDTTLEAKPPQRRADGNALLQFTGDPAIAPVLDADERMAVPDDDVLRRPTSGSTTAVSPSIPASSTN